MFERIAGWIFLTVIPFAGLYFHIKGKIGKTIFGSLLAFAIIVFLICKIGTDYIKKVEFLSLSFETFERKVGGITDDAERKTNKITDDAIEQIKIELIHAKKEITSLTKKVAFVEMSVEDLQEKISKIANAQKEKLEREFPKGYEVGGVAKGKFIPPEEIQIPGLSIDWSLVRIEKATSEDIFIHMPNFSYMGNSAIETGFVIPRKVGIKNNLIAFGNITFQAEVIYIKDDLTVVAFGFLIK